MVRMRIRKENTGTWGAFLMLPRVAMVMAYSCPIVKHLVSRKA